MTPWHAMKAAIQVAVIAALSVQPCTAQETLIQKLLRISGLTAAPSQMRGPGDEVDPGNIWIADLDRHTTKAVTDGGGYRSPVFSSDGKIYALRGDTIVRISPGGGPAAPVRKASGAEKLVGFESDGADDIVVLFDTAGAASPLGVVSLKSGRITPLPYDPKSDGQRRMVAQVRAQDRVYGDTTVYTKTETKRGLSRNIEWMDVYIRRGNGEPQNISGCDGVSCVQPALSPDRRSVAYVKTQG
jgi:hypothetical protein